MQLQLRHAYLPLPPLQSDAYARLDAKTKNLTLQVSEAAFAAHDELEK